MIDYRFTYLFMDSLFLLVWLLLFFWRKHNRQEMVVMSMAGSLLFFGDYFFTVDWWHPKFLIGNRVGLESVLFGAVIGGITSVVYEDIFKVRVKKRRAKKARLSALLMMLGLGLILFLISFYLFSLNSFLSSISASLPLIIFVFVKRRDLIIDGVSTGLILLLLTAGVYTVVEKVYPGWIDAFWYFQNTPRMVIWNIPIDDVIWYFLAGLYVGPLYEYWQEGRLVSDRSA